jgi:DNA-binding SARP family transcriptional activator/BarA-like signal transduction histidine kinase
MTSVQVRLFGEFSVVDGNGSAIPISGRRTQALAIFLALSSAGQATYREAARLIIGADVDDARIREIVRDLRYAMRAVPDVIVETADGVAFNPDRVTVDAVEFEQIVESRAVPRLRLAVELYRSNLLEGFTGGTAVFDDWLIEKRLSYWRAAVSAFGRLLAAQVKAGWWESAVETASRLLALDPSEEVVHRTLMRLQLEQGRADSAMRRYEECAGVLRREFGREPSPETQRVRDEILTALEAAPAPREATKSPDSPVLVLVVEDDAVSATLIEGYLHDGGYEVVTVADGGDALMEIARRTFDLLILDINIPTLNGLRLFEIMIQKGIETPAVFVTGIPGPEVEARSLELGAAEFMRKPIRKEVLLRHVRAILQRKLHGSVAGR